MLGVLLSLVTLVMVVIKLEFYWFIMVSWCFILSLMFLVKSHMMFDYFSFFGYSLDLLSIMMMGLSVWILGLMFMASKRVWMSKNSEKMFSFLCLSLGVVLLMAFGSSSMLSFYVFFEASLVPTFLLVLGWGYQPERLQAGMYLLLYTISASLPLLLSIGLMGSSSYTVMFYMPDWDMVFFSGISYGWWILTIFAFLVKTPMFLVHLWLPKAHVEAPVAGSMVLAAILLKLGTFGLLRLSWKFSGLNMVVFCEVSSICLVGAVISSLICIRQSDLKSLVAYSSVAHMGLATSGILSGSFWGTAGAFVMMLAHGLCSSGLFNYVNMIYEESGSRSFYISSGMLTVFPKMSFWCFLLVGINMAAPPSPNLLGEIELIMGVMVSSFWSFCLLASITFFAGSYCLVFYTMTQHGALSNFMNSVSVMASRNYSSMLLHVVPLLLLIMKSDMVNMWM